MGITCSQDMHAEQALGSQFNTDITCSIIMHAEQVLKFQFHMHAGQVLKSQFRILPAAKSRMLNRFENDNLMYHLQPKSCMLNRF